MPGLLDIAPPEVVREKVLFRDGDLELRGLTNREWIMLGRRFPSLQRLTGRVEADGGLPREMLGEIINSDAAIEGLDLIAAVIAIAIDQPGEATEAEIHKRLSEPEQQQCFNIVMRLTHPPAPLAVSPAMAGQAGNGGGSMRGMPRPSSS